MIEIKGWCNSGLIVFYINDDVNKMGISYRLIYWGCDWFYSKVFIGFVMVRYFRMLVNCVKGIVFLYRIVIVLFVV